MKRRVSSRRKCQNGLNGAILNLWKICKSFNSFLFPYLQSKWKYWNRPKIENRNGASGKTFSYTQLLRITSRTSVCVSVCLPLPASVVIYNQCSFSKIPGSENERNNSLPEPQGIASTSTDTCTFCQNPTSLFMFISECPPTTSISRNARETQRNITQSQEQAFWAFRKLDEVNHAILRAGLGAIWVNILNIHSDGAKGRKANRRDTRHRKTPIDPSPTATVPMTPYVTTLNFHDISNEIRRCEVLLLRRRYMTIVVEQYYTTYYNNCSCSS
ncbi:unnamed protein product [Nesidiocoris tenuis]|uniref:Uncharacterized protein n=1 Tax=Nesidiocoris tenuis TaxID=355587 RepID=A0A6H5FVC0_9HEMI|nr:unnamed protein product [Nesidiocoris tenuis]